VESRTGGVLGSDIVGESRKIRAQIGELSTHHITLLAINRDSWGGEKSFFSFFSRLRAFIDFFCVLIGNASFVLCTLVLALPVPPFTARKQS